MDTLAIDLTDLEKPVAPDDGEIFGPKNPIDALATQGQTISTSFSLARRPL